MEYDGESGESVSSMSEIEDVEEVFEAESSPDIPIDEKSKCVQKCESEKDGSPIVCVGGDNDITNKDQETVRLNDEPKEIKTEEPKKSPTPEKGCSLQTDRWSPKIKNVCHMPHDDSLPQVKSETGHLVLVNEDEIKQEEELLNENDEHTSYSNDLQKSIFAEYPNLKIKDEFNFRCCSIKLEKIDLTHLPSISTSYSLRTPEHAPSSPPVSSRVRNRRAKKRVLRQRASREKKSAVRSQRATKSNTSVRGKSSSRLKQTASDEKTSETRAQRPKRSSGEYESRKRSSSNISAKTRSSVAFLDESETDLSQHPKSKKVRFMEAHGLTDRQESISKSKDHTNLNSSTKKKSVSFADNKGLDLVIEEKEKDPVEDYKRAIAKYSSEIDLYKRELNSWFECLCCDRKFNLLEQCQVHVREHFPGMLTS